MISQPSTGTIRNCPNEPAAAATPMAHERFRAQSAGPDAVNHGVGGARLRRPDQAPPVVGGKQERVGDSAMPARPRPHKTAPPISTRKAPNRSAAMPAKIPITPQDRFCSAAQSERLARPPHLLGDGLQPQAKAVAHAHGQGDDGTRRRPAPGTWIAGRIRYASQECSQIVELCLHQRPIQCERRRGRLVFIQSLRAPLQSAPWQPNLLCFRKRIFRRLDPRAQKGPGARQAAPGHVHRTDNPCTSSREVLDNAADEALAGFGKKIGHLHADGSVSVEDDGRASRWPAPEEKAPVIELVFTRLHAGGKFDKGKGGAYSFSGGLHGVGVSVTNALATRLEATSHREGQVARLVFAGGDVVEPLVAQPLEAGERKQGTTVRAPGPTPSILKSSALPMGELTTCCAARRC